MKRSLLLCLTVASLVSCGGGGGGGEDSAIEGTWRGNLTQGVVVCSDGTAFGAGGGSTIREVELEVIGSDVIGSAIQTIDGNCSYQGTRSVSGFTADAVSGCEQGLTSLSFTLLEDGSAAVSYHYDINLVPAGETGVRCVTTPSANLKR
jgi:hypothetical protein